MTKSEYQKALNDLLRSMYGQEVKHVTFGVGTIIGFDKNMCVVKYDESMNYKLMDMEEFFEYNAPLLNSTLDNLNAIKREYELSKKTPSRFKEGDKTIIKPSKDENKITFDDVIGLEGVKETVNQMVVYPFKYKKIYDAFKRDSGGGILLYGAPGTGKTMIAKAIASEVDAEFFSIKCSDIASKWYGESERKIKELFSEARKHERSIIFFDEFDSLGINRDGQNSNAVNMVVSELLSQIDGFEGRANTILLITSTNKPWNIDSALLRSGRFSKKIYIDLPNQTSRINLLRHEFKGFPLTEIDYLEIAKKTDGYSNADIVELCNESKDVAIRRSISLKKISPIEQEDIIKAMSVVSSTIVKDELDKLASFSI